MSRQPEEQGQGVDGFSVFRFPEKDGSSGKSALQSSASSGSKVASWTSLVAKEHRQEDRTATSGSYVRTSFSSAPAKPVAKRVVKTPPAQDNPSGETLKPVAGSEAVIKAEESEQPQKEAVDPDAIQKVLDEMFQKGLEQGRQEGRAEQLELVAAEARQSGFTEGQQQGITQGFQQGLEKAEQVLQSRYAALERLSDELTGQRKILDDRQSGLAARLLEKLLLEILRVELRHSPERIKTVVREALALLDAGDQEVLRVYLHPDDMVWIADLADSGHLTLRLIEDSQLMQGGCRVEGVLGDVDATLESRLSAGIEHIRSVLGDDAFDSQPDIPTVVEEFSVSVRQSGSNPTANIPAVKSSASGGGVRGPVAAAPSFSFDPGSSSELGAWDSLGQ